MRSLWEDTTKCPDFAPLNQDTNTDVLIIGGGMAGVLCAALLDQSGIDYVLVEANTVCSGITKNTTAKITSQHGLIYDTLLRRFGLTKARHYLQANEMALARYRKWCHSIDCDFVQKDAYVYSLDDREKINKEFAALHKLGYPAQLSKNPQLPFPVAGAIKFPAQAQFHPLKFLSGAAKGLHIYEHTTVRALAGTTAVTDRGRIRAKRIIVATHFPFLNKHGAYFLKLYQHRSYVIALENAPDLHGMYVDEAQTGMSFRNADGLLLIGGGDHRTGKQGGNWAALRDFAKRYYPDATEKYHWAAQDCMTLDGIPYIGRYGAGTEGLYVATGFNKWGMTSSMVAAMLLTDEMCGKQNPYSDVFNPSRSILRPQLALNGLEAVLNLLTPTPKRCPHLGCALKWNAPEHTWDCPCHGSRFTKDGRLIDNPATGNLKR